MADLLRDETRPPNFSFSHPNRKGPSALHKDFLYKKRIVLLFLPDDIYKNDSIRRTYRAMYGRVVSNWHEFKIRDMAVLVIRGRGVVIPESRAVPSSADFVIVTNADNTITAKYGGAPAFYLVGKDGGIKRASRRCPTVADLFRQIDAMPMRRQEMRDRSETSH